MRYFITNFCGNLELTFVALHRVLKNKCDLFFVFLSVCTTLAAVECHSRTREACSAHRVPLKMRRVPQEPILRTARIFRTTGGLLRYRMSRMPQMAGERSLFPRRNHRQIPHKCQEKGLFPRQHYRKSNKHQKKEASSPDGTIGKFPTTAIPWQQGNIYSGGGAPTHGFNYFLTLFL